MGRSVMGCFSLLLGDSSEEHDTFYCSLSEDINQLEQSLSGGSFSLRWSVEAMNMLKKVQVEQLAIIRKSKLPISSGDKDGWFDQYMHDSIQMLDFCNSIKFAVSRINRHRMMVDVMVLKLTTNGSLHKFSSGTIEFERIEIEMQKKLNNLSTVRMLRETVGLSSRVQAEGSGKENKSITAMMLAAKSAMVVVSLILVSAIVSPVPIELGGSHLTSKFPQLKPFIEMLSALICRFHGMASAELNGAGLALMEYEIIGRVMVDLQEQFVEGVEDKERFMSSVELLRSSSAELREGIEKFDAAVDDVFDVVMRGRNEMLEVLRDNDLLMG